MTVDFDGSPASVTVTSSRARHRVRRWAAHTDVGPGELLDRLFGGVRTVHHSEVEIVLGDEEPALSW